MRIIAGTARSRRLVAPPGQTTRPMTDRMREALFSSIAMLVPDSIVLDLYAGTGSMGLEALSRGAATVTFVEQDRAALGALRTNIETVGCGGRVVAGDVDRFLGRASGEFDLVFVDPPYAVALPSLLETLKAVSSLLAQNGLVVVHRWHGEQLPESIDDLALVERRQYGGAELWRYTKEQS
jgi:16S rRNA (guanine966-N2)-methyltransferase